MLDIKMLSIDDNGVITELDRTGYKKVGVSIKLATNFSEAERILKAGDIDVIVINYDYEAMDAVLLCNHYKSHPMSAHIPIVITSVQNVAKHLKKTLKYGADLFIEQPVPRQYFIEKLRALLDQKTRTTNRIVLNSTVKFQFNGKEVESMISDISKSGILIATEENLPIERALELSFFLPGYKKPIQVRGVVVRQMSQNPENGEDMVGYGVRFEEFEGDSQRRLEKYVEKTQSSDPKLVYYL